MIFELLNQFLFLFVHCPLSIVNLNPRCAKTDTHIREPFITSEDFEYARTLMKKLKSPDTGAERIDNIAPNVTKPDYRPNLSEGDVNFRGRPLRFAVDHINNIPMVHDDVIDLDNAVSDKLKIWTFGLVPHRVSLKFNDTQRAIIAMAMEEFHNKTCITWIKARPHEQDYVMLDLAPNPTCSSEIGKNPGKNQMLLSPICLENMGNIVHEMMHALGFIHEHCRHDRDKYVDIQWDNIPNGRFNKNYLIYGLDVIDNLNTNYDYSSVMHYPRYNKGKEIVVPKIDVKIGQRDGLSPNDVYKIKKLYNCDGADDLAPICDRKIECVRKAQDGYCKTNSVEMLQNCSSYCALCSKNIEPESTMIIEDQYCYAFASLGLCEINPRHMKTYCQTACGTQGATVENADNFTTNYPSDCKSTLNTEVEARSSHIKVETQWKALIKAKNAVQVRSTALKNTIKAVAKESLNYTTKKADKLHQKTKAILRAVKSTSPEAIKIFDKKIDKHVTRHLKAAIVGLKVGVKYATGDVSGALNTMFNSLVAKATEIAKDDKDKYFKPMRNLGKKLKPFVKTILKNIPFCILPTICTCVKEYGGVGCLEVGSDVIKKIYSAITSAIKGTNWSAGNNKHPHRIVALKQVTELLLFSELIQDDAFHEYMDIIGDEIEACMTIESYQTPTLQSLQNCMRYRTKTSYRLQRFDNSHKGEHLKALTRQAATLLEGIDQLAKLEGYGNAQNIENAIRRSAAADVAPINLLNETLASEQGDDGHNRYVLIAPVVIEDYHSKYALKIGELVNPFPTCNITNYQKLSEQEIGVDTETDATAVVQLLVFEGVPVIMLIDGMVDGDTYLFKFNCDSDL